MAQLAGQVAIITGAGSGVGRATARALAAEGAAVVLVGRTEAKLRETAALIEETTGRGAENVTIAACDVSDPAQVRDMVTQTHARYGRIDLLVNNAGLNVPGRALAVLSLEDWQRTMRTNLDGCYNCVHAALPLMRAQGGGTFVHIGSQAARRPGALGGAAYTASKAGLAGLSAVINAEERANNIRSSVIVLGDTDTPLLDERPKPPSAASRALSLQSDDVAACIVLIAALPMRATVEELVLLPTQPV